METLAPLGSIRVSLRDSEDPPTGLKCQEMLFGTVDWHVNFAEEPTPTIAC